MNPTHDGDWTVRTLKEYFEALRREDERAIVLLRLDVTAQLERLGISLSDLKNTVVEFNASYGGSEKRGSRDYAAILAIINIVGLIALVFVEYFVRH